MFHSTQTCGRCGNLVDFRFDYVGDFTAMKATARVPGTNMSHAARVIAKLTHEDDEAYGAAMGYCPRCGGPSLITFATSKKFIGNIIAGLKEPGTLFGGESLIRVIDVQPVTPQAHSDPFWPAEIQKPFADAQNMLVQHMSPSIIISVCRTVLDVATKQLGGKGNGIMGRVDDLHQKGIITAAIAEWSHDLRVFGNDATHDATGTEADAREFVEFLKTFLNIAFTLPATISARRQAATPSESTS